MFACASSAPIAHRAAQRPPLFLSAAASFLVRRCWRVACRLSLCLSPCSARTATDMQWMEPARRHRHRRRRRRRHPDHRRTGQRTQRPPSAHQTHKKTNRRKMHSSSGSISSGRMRLRWLRRRPCCRLRRHRSPPAVWPLRSLRLDPRTPLLCVSAAPASPLASLCRSGGQVRGRACSCMHRRQRRDRLGVRLLVSLPAV